MSKVIVAAANINFDFTLVKYEAPKKYQQLGKLLSLKRKHNAELGIVYKVLDELIDGVVWDPGLVVEEQGLRVEVCRGCFAGVLEFLIERLGELTIFRVCLGSC